MLELVFEKLDNWVANENRLASSGSGLLIPKSNFKLVGQYGLLEANLSFEITTTMDVDAISNARFEVLVKLGELLAANGQELDPLSNEIWMPQETEYAEFYVGKFILVERALPEFILLSKAMKAPEKNLLLIRRYIAFGPPKKFFDLAEKYKVNLEAFLGV